MAKTISLIQVEFYGVARHRAGTPMARLPTAKAMSLQTVWQEVIDQYPQLLSPGSQTFENALIYRFNIDGERFVTDPLTPIQPGQSVLVMSADAGG